MSDSAQTAAWIRSMPRRNGLRSIPAQRSSQPRRLIILPGRAWRPANSSRARYTADAGLTGHETIV